MEIVSGAGVNGAIVTCLETIRALVKRGHQITLVCRPRAWIAQQFAPGEIKIVESDLHRWPLDELRRIAALARQTEIDIVHTHMSRANFFGVLLRRLFGLPCVATANNRYIQLHWMFNDRVIAASQATKRFHNRFNLVPKRRIDVVYNFIDCSRYSAISAERAASLRQSLGLSPLDVVISQVGDVIPRKGLVYLVRAMEHVIRQCPNARLLVVGKEDAGYANAVREEIDRLRLHSSVVWTGHRSDIADLLACVDVFALSTLEDNLPLAILEAMASRLPVVASEVGGIPECVVPDETGYLVPARRVEPLSQALLRLARDESLRLRMGLAGRTRAEAIFSYESQISRIEEVFRRVAA
jgi:glycosyltransferase involved in cell wall biosynthesis